MEQVHGRTVFALSPETELRGARRGRDCLDRSGPRDRGAGRRLRADPHRRSGPRVVAAVHAGWRGTCSGIAAAAIELIGELGVPPSDLVAAIGPSIGPCHYQVGDGVRTMFLGMTPDATAWFAEDGLGHWKLDLWQANADRLENAGVPSSAVSVARMCTAENLSDWFSYRAEGSGTGRLVAAIRLGH